VAPDRELAVLSKYVGVGDASRRARALVTELGGTGCAVMARAAGLGVRGEAPQTSYGPCGRWTSGIVFVSNAFVADGATPPFGVRRLSGVRREAADDGVSTARPRTGVRSIEGGAEGEDAGAHAIVGGRRAGGPRGGEEDGGGAGGRGRGSTGTGTGGGAGTGAAEGVLRHTPIERGLATGSDVDAVGGSLPNRTLRVDAGSPRAVLALVVGEDGDKLVATAADRKLETRALAAECED
jgi:hypothetical protein